jgi:protein-S-isoprenylcysteine O-methyltransferase Ste14
LTQSAATSTGVAVVYAVALFVVLIVAPMTVTALKRQWLLFAAGWLTVGLVWWIAAFRLARPDSWWAQRFYGPDKLARAQGRYGAVPA